MSPAESMPRPVGSPVATNVSSGGAGREAGRELERNRIAFELVWSPGLVTATWAFVTYHRNVCEAVRLPSEADTVTRIGPGGAGRAGDVAVPGSMLRPAGNRWPR